MYQGENCGRITRRSRPIALRSSARRTDLIHRLNLDQRGAVIVADPEGRRRRAVVDEDAPDIGLVRQRILDEFSGFGVEPQDAVGIHAAGP